MKKLLSFTCAFACVFALESANAAPPKLKDGVLTLDVGDYAMDFREQAAWTIGNVSHMGAPIITYTGGNQSVINVVRPVQADPEAWIGSAHGGEEVESVVLRVNGEEFPITNPLTAPPGEEYTLVKKSRIGPFQCLTETTLNARGVEQSISFNADQPMDEVRYAYVFMHCWHYRLSEWLAVLPNGERMQENFPSERSTSLEQDISMLALYSPVDKVGVVMAYERPYEGDPPRRNFLNNWPERHNKHYFRTSALQMNGTIYKCRIEAFSTSPDTWVDKAVELGKALWPAKN